MLGRVLAGDDPLRAAARRAAFHRAPACGAAFAGVRPPARVDRHPFADHGDHLEGHRQGPFAAFPDLRRVLRRLPLHAETCSRTGACRCHVRDRGPRTGHRAAGLDSSTRRRPQAARRLHLCRLRRASRLGMCVQGPHGPRMQELVVPPAHTVHRAHAVLPSPRERYPGARADRQHHLRDHWRRWWPRTWTKT